MDRLSLVTTVIGIIVALIAAVMTLTNLFPEAKSLFDFLLGVINNPFVSSALANSAEVSSEAGTTPLDMKVIINNSIMFCILFTYVWSVGVIFHGKTVAQVNRAKDINKMLLGFILGTGKSYMGL